MKECKHEWQWIKDWEGDPSIPNGTNDISRWECRECGKIKYDPPPDMYGEYEYYKGDYDD